MWLFALFVAVPLIEIALFIQAGGAIGLWPTLGIVVLTAILGSWLVRDQGLRALAELRRSLDDLRNPAEPLAHGALILLSGALLLTPGFFTDAIGFLLLIPAVRIAAFTYLRARIHVQSYSTSSDSGRSSPIIDGEFNEIAPPEKKISDSGWTRH